jgi:hypothetical protein
MSNEPTPTNEEHRNLNLDLKLELEKMAQDIDRAFRHSKKVTFINTPYGKATRESVEIAKRNKECLDLIGDDKDLIIDTYNPGENEVVTNSQHLYTKLLQYAYETALENGLIPDVSQDEFIDSATDHEFSHVLKILGSHNVNARYGIGYETDIETGRMQLKKFVTFSGKIKCSLYKEMLSEPNNPSITDRIKLGEIQL